MGIRVPAVKRPPRPRPKFGYLTAMPVGGMAFVPAEPGRKSKMIKYVHKVGDASGRKFTTRTTWAEWATDQWRVVRGDRIPKRAVPGTAVWRVK